ncbi:calcium-binding and coiled-coil domain-containing protein 2 [Megalops cyprinoides]|uniref:calcium-binding and coiled-coil domain-containing protein 2 n=1 Tax=Megalops cyprinoides TaxID=118141 RepID=UPI0018644165|nr:calcium-binding and coiled-coil domain-containing protein 2 [Megalops cyprinoides]
MCESADAPPTSTIMETSTYSQVVFSDVPQSYPPNIPVKCGYAMTAAFQPHRRDWVGIFKVGWNTTRDYYTFVWATPSADPMGEEPLGQHVMFDAYYLPKEDGEFYQFCYVDSSGQVRGASIPFRFESPPESSLEYSMGSDLLVITTQEQVEQVEKEKEELHKEMEKQKETVEILRSELDERLLEIRRLRDSNTELAESVGRLEQEQAQSKKEREEERELWAQQQQRERETLLSQQGAIQVQLAQSSMGLEFQRGKEELQQTVSTLQEKYERAVSKISQLKQERDELKEKGEAQEVEITQLSSRVRELEQEKQQGHEELCKLQDNIQLLQVDLQSSQKECVKLAGELRGLRVQADEAEGLRRENQALQRTLSGQEEHKREDDGRQAQCEALASELQEVKAKLCQEKRSSEEARRRAEQARQELQEAKEDLEQRIISFQQKEMINNKVEIQLMEARQTIAEQANIVEIVQGEKKELSQENQDLRRDNQRLRDELAHLQAASPPASIPLQYPNPYSPQSVPSGTQSPGTGSLLYENVVDTPAIQDTAEELRVCRYCQEIFPDISQQELEQHEGSHKVCPFCMFICDSMEQREFEEHVYSHET